MTLVVVATIVGALLLGACGVGRADPSESVTDDATDELQTTDGTFPAVTWDLVEQRFRERVTAAGLDGGRLTVSARRGDQEDVVSYGSGGVDGSTVVPLAETSMLTTTAVLLTLVDDGTLSLDEPIGPTLPWLTGPAGAITLRQLLSHTSGLPASVECAEPTPAACDAAIAAAPLIEAPGEGFHVTDLDAHVAARLAETATGRPWEQLFLSRVAFPAGMADTAYADPSTTGGLVGVDGVTTPDDLGRLLAVIRDNGVADEREPRALRGVGAPDAPRPDRAPRHPHRALGRRDRRAHLRARRVARPPARRRLRLGGLGPQPLRALPVRRRQPLGLGHRRGRRPDQPPGRRRQRLVGASPSSAPPPSATPPTEHLSLPASWLTSCRKPTRW